MGHRAADARYLQAPSAPAVRAGPDGFAIRHPSCVRPSTIEWTARNVTGSHALASGLPPLLAFAPAFDTRPHAMSHLNSVHHSSADHGTGCAGAAWLDVGGLCGLIVVDSNRPAFGAGTARGLLKQFAAAH